MFKVSSFVEEEGEMSSIHSGDAFLGFTIHLHHKSLEHGCMAFDEGSGGVGARA